MSNNKNEQYECPGCKQNTSENSYKYRIQVGLFRIYNNALNLQLQLVNMGLPAEIVRQGEFYAVHVGEFCSLDNAAEFERILRMSGYDTLLVAV